MAGFQKAVIISLLLILIILNLILFTLINKLFISEPASEDGIMPAGENKSYYIAGEYDGEYEVYQNDRLIKYFDDYNEALKYASACENAAIKKNGGGWLWDNTPLYNVYPYQSDEFKAFSSFRQAVDYADSLGAADIFYRNVKGFIWNNHEPLKKSHIITDVPLISQYPELYRGCEVTSLCMLLNYLRIDVSKLTLAENIAKCPAEFTTNSGEIMRSHPNTGFVGDIYDRSRKGLGVYHKPIYELLTAYVGAEALDITGCRMEDILFFVSKNRPVWIITNTKFRRLDTSQFQTWKTPEGNINVTFSEHSVLVTGYDENYIYFNDPMNSDGTKKAEKKAFTEAWEQLGSQAVTCCP